jgi:hypothetical protein
MRIHHGFLKPNGAGMGMALHLVEQCVDLGPNVFRGKSKIVQAAAHKTIAAKALELRPGLIRGKAEKLQSRRPIRLMEAVHRPFEKVPEGLGETVPDQRIFDEIEQAPGAFVSHARPIQGGLQQKAAQKKIAPIVCDHFLKKFPARRLSEKWKRLTNRLQKGEGILALSVHARGPSPLEDF